MQHNWYRLDNVAKMFVATQTRRDPRVFRLSCTLDEAVDGEKLNTALASTARQFPEFEVTLHKGLFWHYLESTDKIPKAEPEHLVPCAELYGPAHHNALLYRVSWYESRINFEVFHVLSDGTGAMDFFKTLLYLYLKLCHPAEMADTVPDYDASAADRVQDSFSQFYEKNASPAVPQSHGTVVHLHGLRLPFDQTQFFEIHLPTDKLLKRARAMHVSATSYLAAAMMLAIRKETPMLERMRPVVISLPVNLRNYFPSATARNFFNTVQVGHTFSSPEESLETVAQDVDAKLKEQLKPENIRNMMDSFEKLEQLMAIKAVPLAIKNLAVKYFTDVQNRNETATLSNIGPIRLAPALTAHIKYFGAYCSARNLFITVNSFGNEMVLGASSVFRSTNILKNLVRGLAADGMDITLYASEVKTE